MFRRKLIDILLNNFMTVPQIARAVDESPSTIESDLKHLQKSLKHTEYMMEITPAECRKCGFEFSEDKLKKPSRCPECHSTWLHEPELRIVTREQKA